MGNTGDSPIMVAINTVLDSHGMKGKRVGLTKRMVTLSDLDQL